MQINTPCFPRSEVEGGKAIIREAKGGSMLVGIRADKNKGATSKFLRGRLPSPVYPAPGETSGRAPPVLHQR